MKIKPLLICICVLILSASANAQEAKKFNFVPPDFSELVLTGEVMVDQVIDPLRLRLQDGRIIQLAGLDIPDLTPYDTGDVGLAALATLREKLTRKHIKIYQVKSKTKGRKNRMGYHLAHIAEKNSGEWIQGFYLANGLARVRPSAINIEMAEQMKTREDAARKAQQGLWLSENYKVHTPDTAENALNSWAIVEGKVKASAMANNTVYLNFGADWRKDFTIGIPSSIRKQMADGGSAVLQLAHKKVRIRGWVENYNGPYIELMDPVWIDILPDEEEAVSLGQ